ncbi:MAG: hypothetical protein J6Z31_07800, partial [Fibrobacter sp.]|nr:hypothetical protein [Fibrobacter sp.]
AYGYASHVVNLALARYNSFTGQIALSSFSEDQQLMAVVQSVKKDLLPLIATAKPWAFAFGILMAILGGVCEAIPKLVATALLKLHVLKPATGDLNEAPECFRRRLRILAIVVCAIALICLVMGLIFHFNDPGRDTPSKVLELEKEASRYYSLQKAYFQKHQAIGTWVQIGYEAPTSENFVFEKQGKYSWRAKNISKWEECPDSSVWKVTFEVTGFFSKELKTYASRPNLEACESLTPEFRKNVLSK